MEYGCSQATACQYPYSIQIMGYAYGRENLFIYLDIFCPVILYPVNNNRLDLLKLWKRMLVLCFSLFYNKTNSFFQKTKFMPGKLHVEWMFDLMWRLIFRKLFSASMILNLKWKYTLLYKNNFPRLRA